jgi:hypothetical protein
MPSPIKPISGFVFLILFFLKFKCFVKNVHNF